MKKKIIYLVFACIMGLSLSACGNKQLFDTTYTFNKAILSLPDGTVIAGKVTSWKDFSDGDQVQVVIDGTTYLLHTANVALISN